jgi:hypothetical protein
MHNEAQATQLHYRPSARKQGAIAFQLLHNLTLMEEQMEAPAIRLSHRPSTSKQQKAPAFRLLHLAPDKQHEATEIRLRHHPGP